MQLVRWGIIGTGDVAERKGGPALYQAARSRLVAVTNRTRSRAQAFAARHGNPHVHDTVASLLDDPHVDAVYVATPPASHAELTQQAARAGKHVLCEKPMACAVEDCQRMIQACDEHGVSLAIAYYRRYFPVVQKMKQLLEAGAVGRPLRVAATTIAPFPAEQADPWRLAADVAGGGFLMDVGTHRLDLMAYLFGAAQQVKCVLGTQGLTTQGGGAATSSALPRRRDRKVVTKTEVSRSAMQVEDVASLALEFSAGVHGSAAFHWNCPVPRDTFEIVGTAGILSTHSLSDAGRLTLDTPAGREIWHLPASPPVHLNLVSEFVDHLLGEQPNPLPGTAGMLATVIVQQAYEQH